MAFGDVGGVITELVITCKTPSTGTVNIVKGEALKLSGPYVITNATSAEDALFGQALASVDTVDTAIPVKVRGICIFPYTGAAPIVDGVAGLVASATAGSVKAPASGNGKGINLKVDEALGQVHILL